MVTAMLFAGGIGARMQSSDLPKQFLEVGGKPIIIHTMEHFSKHPMVDAIVVACKEDWIDYLVELVERYSVKKVRSIVPGGATGFGSIRNGVRAVSGFARNNDDLILICDGVRPMLTPRLITDCIEHTKKYSTAVPVTPALTIIFTTNAAMETRRAMPRIFRMVLPSMRLAALPPMAAPITRNSMNRISVSVSAVFSARR